MVLEIFCFLFSLYCIVLLCRVLLLFVFAFYFTLLCCIAFFNVIFLGGLHLFIFVCTVFLYCITYCIATGLLYYYYYN